MQKQLEGTHRSILMTVQMEHPHRWSAQLQLMSNRAGINA